MTWRRPLGFAAIVGLAVAAYIPAFGGEFIWDDETWVTANRALRTMDGLRAIWLTPSATPQYYPLLQTVLWAEYHLWGPHPLGYHLVNVLLHALNAGLVWLVLRRLAIPGSWMAAAVFALHPVHVESVAWITELKNVQSTFFYLLALLAYLRFAFHGQSMGLYALAFLAFVLAVLSKTVACTLPAGILVLLWLKRGRIDRFDVARLAPFFLVGLVGGLGTALVEKHQVGAQGADWSLSPADRCLLAGRALWFYAAKTLVPIRLTFVYPRWQIDATAWWQWLFPLAAAAVPGVLWALRGRVGRGPLAAVLYFAITLGPALGFVDVYPFRFSFVADHFQYLASLGLIALFVAVATAGARRLPGRPFRALTAVGCGVLLVVLGSATWSRAHVFADQERLWRDTLAKNPAAWMAHVNLGDLLLNNGRPAEAIPYLDRGLALKPDVPESYHSRGNAARAMGRPDEARTFYERSLQVDPRYAPAYNALGLLLLDQRKEVEAAEEFQRAARLRPDFSDPPFNLGNISAARGNFEEAEAYYERALQIDPEFAKAHNNLANVYAYRGKIEQAIAHYEKALELQPDLGEARRNLDKVRDRLRR
jgi:protein O-mannosyl-transferase